MKKLSAVVLSLMLCVSVSFAARGGSSSSSSSSKSSSSSSSSSSGSFGIGYSKMQIDTGAQWVGVLSFDQVAGRYWFNDDFGIDVRLGFGSGDLNTRIMLGAKVIGNIIKVNKLNVYWLAGIDFGSYKLKRGTGNDIDFSMFGVQGGFGAEYYVLPCLSVLTEMGIRYISVKPDIQGVSSQSDFGVFADWLPQAGVRFYF